MLAKDRKLLNVVVKITNERSRGDPSFCQVRAIRCSHRSRVPFLSLERART
jgi:hypothetical protein